MIPARGRLTRRSCRLANQRRQRYCSLQRLGESAREGVPCSCTSFLCHCNHHFQIFRFSRTCYREKRAGHLVAEHVGSSSKYRTSTAWQVVLPFRQVISHDVSLSTVAPFALSSRSWKPALRVMYRDASHATPCCCISWNHSTDTMEMSLERRRPCNRQRTPIACTPVVDGCRHCQVLQQWYRRGRTQACSDSGLA